MINTIGGLPMKKVYNCLECGQENLWGHSKINKYCNNACQREYEYKQRIKAWLTEGKSWKTQVPQWPKRYLAEVNGRKCSVCSLEDWMGKEITLEVDHIDGRHYNNNVENLRLICPNCHSQTDTYKNKNKGNGRKYR